MPTDILTPNGQGGWTATGSLAECLLANDMDTSGLRTNGVLRKDEWEYMDKAILEANRSRSIGIADLKSMGLTYQLPNALGVMQFEYEKQSKMGDAEINMDAETQGERDRLTYSTGYLPIPIIHQDYSLNARAVAASRRNGTAIDTAHAEEAAKTVMEKEEKILFQGGGSFKFGDGTLYGYVDHPDRTIGSFTAWTASGADPVANARAMKQSLIDDGFYGPYALYVPTGYETVLDDDYVIGYPKTVRDRLLEIGGLNIVKVADYLTAGQMVLVNMDKSTVRLIEGMPVTNIEWKVGAGMRTNFKVMTIEVPQIRSDKDSNCGVVHYTAS